MQHERTFEAPYLSWTPRDLGEWVSCQGSEVWKFVIQMLVGVNPETYNSEVFRQEFQEAYEDIYGVVEDDHIEAEFAGWVSLFGYEVDD